jgi:hypothetical protein
LQHAAAGGYSLFSQSSFWNTQIPRYPSLHSASLAEGQNVATQASSYGASVDVSAKSSPVYIADPNEATQAVVPWDCLGGGADTSLTADWQAVPIPYYAQPGDGPTHPMTIFQPLTGSLWEFDYMQKIAGQWQACHGGRLDSVSGSGGVFQGTKGANDTGLPFAGGQVSINDLRRGVIGHAIGLRLPQTSGLSWPAVRSTGSGGVVAQGQRFQLDPLLNVDTLGLAPAAKMIAKAAQKYGLGE